MKSSQLINQISAYLIGLMYVLWILAFFAPDDLFALSKLTNSPFSTFVIVDLIPKIGLGFFFLTLVRRQKLACLANLILVFAFLITFSIKWFITG